MRNRKEMIAVRRGDYVRASYVLARHMERWAKRAINRARRGYASNLNGHIAD